MNLLDTYCRHKISFNGWLYLALSAAALLLPFQA